MDPAVRCAPVDECQYAQPLRNSCPTPPSAYSTGGSVAGPRIPPVPPVEVNSAARWASTAGAFVEPNQSVKMRQKFRLPYAEHPSPVP